MELSFRQYPRNPEFLLRLRERVNTLLGKQTIESGRNNGAAGDRSKDRS